MSDDDDDDEYDYMSEDDNMSGMSGGDDDDDDASDDNSQFDAPAVTHQESMFAVLGPEECEALASRAVDQTCELLCCEREHAALLLRQFKWDRSRLAEGALAVQARCGAASTPCLLACAAA